MGKILVISQNENDVWFVNGLSIGRREPRIVVGTKIKELLEKKVKTTPTGLVATLEKGVSEEEFIKDIGTNFSESLKRVLEDREIPKEKLFDKIVSYFGVEKDFFYDKELENVIVNDSRMILAEYSTNDKAKEVMAKVRTAITNDFSKGEPIIINLPKE